MQRGRQVVIQRILHIVFLAFFLIQAAVGGQGSEVTRILGEIRSALGGDSSLASVKTLAIEGQTTRVTPNGESVAQDFEIAIDLDPKAPKYMKRDVIANMNGNVVSRRSGFNGNELIYEVDAPPELTGGGGTMRFTPMSALGPNATSEQIAEQSKQRLLTAKREFTRLAIAVLGAATTAYPVEFKYVGVVDGKDGKTTALELTSADGFKATLYVDGKSHLPVSLSWMDKEPVRLTMSSGGGNSLSVGGGTTVITSSADGPRTPEEIAQMQADMQRRIKEAEANRRVVEFRVVYGDYKTINGVRIPTRLQHTIDGNPTEQITLQKVSPNAKVDAKFRR